MDLWRFINDYNNNNNNNVLNGGMRITYGGADPPRNGGCTKLLTGVIVLDWNKKTASVLPQFWVLSEVSVIITQSSHRTVRSAKL